MRHKHIAGKHRHVRGWRRSHPDHRDFLLTEPATTGVPAKADLTPLCPPIRDQGSIGSCTANSSLEAMGFLYTKYDKTDPQLSRLFTYYYSRKMEGTPPTEDSGCQIRDVMKCLSVYGSCLEATWPYLDDGKDYAVEPPHPAYMEAQKHKLLLYYRCPTLATIKASIAQGFPAVGGFECPANMFTDECARTGVIKYPTPSEQFEGGHAVLFVAYDNATGLLKFQNSWGTSWGDKGFGYLPFAFVENNLADDFWTLRREQQP